MPGLAVVGCGGDSQHVSCGDFRFDRSAWRHAYENYSTDEPTPAEQIADKLLACKTLEHRSRRETLRLLGRPDNYVAHSRREMSWNLGSERSYFSIDDEHLVVRFDQRGRVRRAFLTTD